MTLLMKRLGGGRGGGRPRNFLLLFGDHLKLHLAAVFPFFFFPGRLPENGTTLVAVRSVFLPPGPSDVNFSPFRRLSRRQAVPMDSDVWIKQGTGLTATELNTPLPACPCELDVVECPLQNWPFVPQQSSKAKCRNCENWPPKNSPVCFCRSHKEGTPLCL